MEKSVSVKTQLALYTGIIVFLTVAVLTSFFVINGRNTALKSTKEKILLIAQSSAHNIENNVNEALLRIQANIDFSLFLRQTPGDHRERLYAYYKNELINIPSLQGVSLVYKPGAFDNLDSQYASVPGYYTDGRLCVYWWRDAGEIVRETEVVNFDEELVASGAEWWEIPLKEKRTYIAMDIYEFKGKNILMLSVYLPIKSDNEYLGVMGYDYQGDFMQTEALNIKKKIFEGKSEINIVADGGNFAANSLSDTIIMKNFKEFYPEKSGFANLMKANSFNDFILQDDTLYLSTPVKFRSYEKDWHINIAIPLSVVMKEVNANLTIQLFMGAILILLSIVLIVFFIGKLIKPLIDLQAATETLTTGKLDLKLVKARGDEIGSLANAFQVMVGKLREIVSGIHTGSSQIFIGSRQISDSAQTISQGASQQASATEQVASSIEEVISAINQNSENAQHAKTIAKRAEKGIIESQQASLNTIEAMKKIAEKTTIITGIAQKTNILAINAAIEAARAGSMGKGFGIVAAEVRNLAESSHLAADDIVKLSDQTLIMSEESGKILSGIVPDVQKTSLLIEEIANASMEQNSGVKQISQAIEQLNSITLQNSATSEELASGSEELVSQAETLKKAVAFFRMESDDITELSLNKEDIPENEISESQYFDLADKDHKLKNNLIPEFKKEINKGLNPDQKGFNLNLDNKTDDDFESF